MRLYSTYVTHVSGVQHTLESLCSPPENRCPICSNTELSNFPILPNESFTFDYNHKRGAELGFEPREKR